MNEEQEAKTEKICELWTDHQNCCNTIVMLINRAREHNNQKDLIISMLDYPDIRICNETMKHLILNGAIDELDHLRDTIKAKISNELGESCK